MKAWGGLILVFLLLACSSAEQLKQEEKFSIDAYFPMQKGCGWVYRLTIEKETGDYPVHVVNASAKASVIKWLDKEVSYSYRDGGIYNNTKDYFLLKDPAISRSWQVPGGIVKILEEKREITVAAGTYKALVTEETAQGTGVKILSFYAAGVGLIKYEIYDSANAGQTSPVSSMELKSYFCGGEEMMLPDTVQ